MKTFLITLLCLGVFTMTEAQEKKVTKQDKKVVQQESEAMLVQASCGKCKLEMEGKSCMLAVVIEGEKYYVEGAGDIHDHDAHGEHGMCSMVRKAYVQGEVKDGKFHATHFELVPVGKAD